MRGATLEAVRPRSLTRDPGPPVHPLGMNARVLLASVFGPYALDDEYGSRAINPMELYHNQVTRVQGVFSLRMFHRSWGLMLIQANLDAPCTLLDFPTLSRFVDELRSVPYDVIGIGAILPNIGKVAKMCALIREHQPEATIVVGGHVANHPRLLDWTVVDHVVKGDGVRWFRGFLSQDKEAPIRHPLIQSAIGSRTLGVNLPKEPGETAATLIPSVGCPLGCNFCSTSAMFGGKGRSVHFYETGDELFAVMLGLAEAMSVQSFFIMDENFLLHRKRALRLLELMRAEGKSWSLYVFSSVNTLRRYTMDEIVGLGVSWVWVGLEGKGSAYNKLEHADTRALVDTLQSHGIRVLGSSIVGLPEHSPRNIDEAIDYAVAHDTEFHQFMLYTPLPGTPLHAEHLAKGTLLADDECPPADSHGQSRFNFRHPLIREGQETGFLHRAFHRDFEQNGPSILRIARTLLRGWQRHKDHPEARVRERYRRECRGLPTTYAGALWAAQHWLRASPLLVRRIADIRQAIVREFGLVARLAGPVAGAFLLAAMHREARRLRVGPSHEPPTFYEINRTGTSAIGDGPSPCRWISAAY